MSDRTIVITSLLISSGDDVFAKDTAGDFSGTDWGEGVVAANEIDDTGVYEVVVDSTKNYVVYRNGTSQAFTADAGTDVITANDHGLTNGQSVLFQGDDLPAPLEQSTTYYVIEATTHAFKVEATLSGGAVNITDAGSGSMVIVAPSKRSKAADVQLGQITGSPEALIGEGELDNLAANILLIKAKTDLLGTLRSLIRW